jgi:hypothetical protein
MATERDALLVPYSPLELRYLRSEGYCECLRYLRE